MKILSRAGTPGISPIFLETVVKGRIYCEKTYKLRPSGNAAAIALLTNQLQKMTLLRPWPLIAAMRTALGGASPSGVGLPSKQDCIAPDGSGVDTPETEEEYQSQGL